MVRADFDRNLEELEAELLLLGKMVEIAIIKAMDALERRDLTLAYEVVAEDDQIVAAVVGTASLLALSFADRVADLLSGTARDVVDGMAMDSHFVDFSRGIIDTTDVAYYLSVAAVGIFLTIRSLEMRRWR